MGNLQLIILYICTLGILFLSFCQFYTFLEDSADVFMEISV